MHSVVRGSIPNPKSQWPKFASRKQASNVFSAKIKNVEGQQDWFEASDLQVSALNKLPALGETRFYGFVNTHLSPKDFNAMVSCVRTHICVNLLSCSSSHHAQSWKLFPVRCPANQLMTHAATISKLDACGCQKHHPCTEDHAFDTLQLTHARAIFMHGQVRQRDHPVVVGAAAGFLDDWRDGAASKWSASYFKTAGIKDVQVKAGTLPYGDSVIKKYVSPVYICAIY